MDIFAVISKLLDAKMVVEVVTPFAAIDEDSAVVQGKLQISARSSNQYTEECILMIMLLPVRGAYATHTAQTAATARTHGQLFAMQVLVEAVKHLSVAEGRELVPLVVPALLPQFSSRLTDIRKNVVFALVELHALVGELCLMPFLHDLTAAQSKLLKIYIDRRLGRAETVPASAVIGVI
jgi:hypothetical protein